MSQESTAALPAGNGNKRKDKGIYIQTVYHIALPDGKPCHTNTIRDKTEAFGLEEQLFVDACNNVNDFLRNKRIYGVLLLDIEMPGMDGIHLTKHIASERTLVIYIMNYADRMEDTFGTNVFRYVLKSKIDEEPERTLQDVFEFLQDNAGFKIRTDGGYGMLAQKGIIYMEYSSKDVYAYAKDREYIFRMYSTKCTTKELSSRFVQIDRVNIVSIEYIRSIHGFELHVEGIDRVPKISRRRKDEIMNTLSQMTTKL